jgi:hypothetical protein
VLFKKNGSGTTFTLVANGTLWRTWKVRGPALSKKKAPQSFRIAGHKSGNDLLSREIPVSSALESLTTVFGMGTGVTSPEESPENRQPSQGQPVFWPISHDSKIGISECITNNLNQYSRAQPTVNRSKSNSLVNFDLAAT